MKNKATPTERAAECIAAWHDTGKTTDVQGSYTGTYKDPDKKAQPMIDRPYIYMNSADTRDLRPVQDADDL